MTAEARLFEAASFAARAHQGQLRKDGRTPYASHPFRVCLVCRQVFGIDDAEVLTAALLHDTIEDTTTDCDDIIAQFGPNVASWVRALTKDKRLPDAEREEEYARALAEAGWQVQVLKLADVYDNLNDSGHFPPDKRRKTLDRSAFYLERIGVQLKPEARPAFEIVQKQLHEIK